MVAGISGDGFAVTLEGEAGGEFVGDKLIVGRSLERQEGFKELLDLGRPVGAMVAAGEVEGEGGWLLKPSGSQAKEVSTADAQELGGGVRAQVAAVESVEGLVQERYGETFGKLMFCKGPLSRSGARRARLFVGLRYAPASSKPGPAGRRLLPSWAGQHQSLILFPPAVSFCSRPNSK